MNPALGMGVSIGVALGLAVFHRIDRHSSAVTFIKVGDQLEKWSVHWV